MLMFLPGTVRIIAGAACMAVLFICPVNAGDSSLVHFEERLNDLVYELSYSIVIVESIKLVPSATGIGSESIRRLISSGVVFDGSGHILAAASSVVSTEQILIRYDDRTLPARLVGIDYQTGLALLQTKEKVGRPAICSEQYLCAGQIVVSMGNAFGVRASPSLGFCAGVREDGQVQFTCPVSSGSVGGGLFGLNGELVGLITGSVGGNGEPAAGLAVPAHKIMEAATYLMLHGDRPAGYIGLTASEIEISPALELAFPSSFVGSGPRQVIDRGLLVISVSPGSPAAKSGIRRNDLLLSYKRIPLISLTDLRRRVVETVPGTIAQMEIMRHNSTFNVAIEVGPRQTLDNGRFQMSSTSTDIDRRSESLSRDIQQLKRALLRLENELNDLRR